MGSRRKQELTRAKKTDLPQKLIDADDHGVTVDGHQRKEFWRSLRLAIRKTKVCSICNAKYSSEQFRIKHVKCAVFFEGQWHMPRKQNCYSCEKQARWFEKSLAEVGT